MTLTPEERRRRTIAYETNKLQFRKFNKRVSNVLDTEHRSNKLAQKYIDDLSDIITEKSGYHEESERLIQPEMEIIVPDIQTTLYQGIAAPKKRRYYKSKKEYNEENQTNLLNA